MVVFIDLDEQDVGSGNNPLDPFDMHDLIGAHAYYYNNSNTTSHDTTDVEEDERPNPNLNAFSAALGCYPIVSEIAKGLDLNSLHDLSQTCRQFRANLLQYRRQLIPQTLRCEFETLDPIGCLNNIFRDTSDAWSTQGVNGERIPRMTSGKVGTCARDMVGECRRCGTVVCRNCVVKAPSPTAFKTRLRRLCRTCIKAPLDQHTKHHANPEEPVDEYTPFEETPSETPPPLYRGPCTCAPNQVWICQPCGSTLRTHDTTYFRGWTWRSRYSTHLHGLGTGIGEGVQGVQCGRESSCLNSRLLFKEIECGNTDLISENGRGASSGERSGGYNSGGRVGGSYYLQEIEGIGGVVKKKRKRRVRVGAVVREYEDEREGGKYLRREQEGANRSWCSWCQRVVGSNRDKVVGDEVEGDGNDPLGRSLAASESSSSSSSTM